MTLQEYIQSHLNINEELPFQVSTKKFNKGDRITDIGETESNIYFIASGIVEQYMVTEHNENIIEFSFENDFVTSLTSLLKGQPSDVYISCLTDCEVQAIPFDELKKACLTSTAINQFYTSFIENYYLTRVQKEKDAVAKTADQRYLEILKNKPHVIRNIPLGHIAMYLGVHPNSLSRIRKKIFDKPPVLKKHQERELMMA